MTYTITKFIIFVMQVLLAGTGTSHGMPVINCLCPRCTSKDPKDNRLRTSAFIRGKNGESIVIDIGPDFRSQALRYGLPSLDAVFITHSHADHLHGLDDVRIFSHTCSFAQNRGADCDTLKVYADRLTIKDIKNRFSYVFKKTQEGGGKPRISLKNVEAYKEKPVKIGNINILPIPLEHGDIGTTGYRIEEDDFSIAYLTDCDGIPKSSLEKLKNLDFLIIDALRKRPHSTHFNFDEALEVAEMLQAKQTYITHICHDYTYEEINAYFAKKSRIPIQSAYDGLILKK